jgi:hypothetical protein
MVMNFMGMVALLAPFAIRSDIPARKGNTL